MTLNTGGNDLKFRFRGAGLALWNLLPDFGSVILSQPRRQLSGDSFPVRDIEPAGLGRPPSRNASVTNERARIKQRTGIGTAKELLALGTGRDTEQSQGPYHG